VPGTGARVRDDAVDSAEGLDARGSAQPHDLTDHLVFRRKCILRTEFAFVQVPIGSADTGHEHLDENLAGSGPGRRDLNELP
jgi:hypothetical protein